MTLTDLLSPEVIKVPIESDTKNGVIEELLDVLVSAGKVASREKALDALLARESLGSTGLESGMAVPHAKTDAVSTLTLAIGIAPAGVDFQALDGNVSTLFFLMLAPPDKSGPHIEALAEIARLGRSTAFLKALTRAGSSQEVYDLLSE